MLCPNSLRDSARILCLLWRSKRVSELKARLTLGRPSDRKHRRLVVRARLLCFELPDSPPDQESGNTETSDSEDSYQSVYEYPDSIYYDVREMFESASLGGERANRRAHCSKTESFCAQAGVIQDMSLKPTERRKVVFRAPSASGRMKVLFGFRLLIAALCPLSLL